MHIQEQEPPEWWVAIDTNSYAGNFERTMGAWCVGITSGPSHEFNHGTLEAMEFLKDHQKDMWALTLENRVGYVNEKDQTRFTIGSNKNQKYAYTVYIPWLGRPSRRHLKFVFARALDYSAKVQAGYFEDKNTISKYNEKTMKVLGVRAVRLRCTIKTSASVGLTNLKKYQKRARKET